jgi:hypothetical protein
VFASGVFHHEGWASGVIDLDEETTAFFVEFHGQVSPDGPGYLPVVAAKLHRMHSEEPILTVADLAGYPGPTLVMVGDDDHEIPMEHTLPCAVGCRGRSWRSCPAPATGCSATSSGCAPGWSSSSSPKGLRGRASRRRLSVWATSCGR